MNISRSIIFILSLLVGARVSAQGFIKTYSPNFSSARDLVQTNDGGYFMVGNVEQDSLLFLQRVDDLGQPVWANHFNFHQAKAIAVCNAADGGFAVLTEFYADTNGYKNAVLKISSTGTVVWTKIIGNLVLPNGMRDIVNTADGGFLLAGDTRDSSLVFQNRLVKLAPDGTIAWEKTFGAFQNTSRIVALPSGNFAVSGGRNGGNFWLSTVTPNGDLLWQNTYGTAYYERAYGLMATVDGGLAILGTTQNAALGRLEIYIVKTDNNGIKQWSKSIFPYEWPGDHTALPLVNGFTQDQAGNYYIPLSDATYAGSGTDILELLKLDPSGNALWKRETNTVGSGLAIIQTNDNYFAIAGAGNNHAILLKLDAEGETYSNKIRGTVFRDENADCAQGAGETALSNFIVEAQGPSGMILFKKTNADGTYEIRVPAGNYGLVAKPAYGPPGFYSVCDTLQVAIVGPNQIVDNQMIGMEALAECPMLEVEIGGGILRRCTQTHYTVSYCNYGNLPAENATMQVTADTALVYTGSSLPIIAQNGNAYTFSLPDVPVGDCGSFTINFFVKCTNSVGDVICVEAHAFPDSSCIPPGAEWDGSELEVTGKCENDSISFNIINKGLLPMSQALDYVIIEDHIMYMQGPVQLGAGMDTTIVIPNPDGACYLGKILDLNNPVTIVSRPTAVVENCITGGNLNLALEFETGENNYAVSTNCSEIVGSYDPNDKTGFPLGWGDQHLLERNQDIEYQIRFQNTGNDTAFLVVVRDTLPLATLDPGSLRPVSASHGYTWDVTDNGVVTFTFPNILLPDSTTNEVESHGFIRFRVRQQPDLEDGIRIKNRAAIFFDFNEPVITNEYFHTVGKPVLLVTHNPGETQLLDFQVLPNPFSSEATFVLKDYTPKNEVSFKLIDALGNIVREERFPGNSFLFTARNLPAGIYFFRMEEDGRLLTTGKVAVSK